MTKKPFDDSARKNDPCRIYFDPQEYLSYLEGMELTDGQAESVLAALWGVMVQFVDLGFQMDFALDNKNSTADVKSRDTNARKIPQRQICKKGEGP